MAGLENQISFTMGSESELVIEVYHIDDCYEYLGGKREAGEGREWRVRKTNGRYWYYEMSVMAPLSGVFTCQPRWHGLSTRPVCKVMSEDFYEKTSDRQRH